MNWGCQNVVLKKNVEDKLLEEGHNWGAIEENREE